jgi:hypothetical protein
VSATVTAVPFPTAPLVYPVARVMSTARPRPPPAWREVLTKPEASPAWAGPAPWVAKIVEGTIESAMPAVVSTPGSTM